MRHTHFERLPSLELIVTEEGFLAVNTNDTGYELEHCSEGVDIMEPGRGCIVEGIATVEPEAYGYGYRANWLSSY